MSDRAQHWQLEHTYQELPDQLYSTQPPTPAEMPKLVCFNEALAEELGLGFLLEDMRTGAWLSGKELPPGANPIAQAYAGHQFGHFTMLGDGRAILLGEQVTPRGERYDIQLKGAGQTPYSRRGDGRATLSSMLREYLMSEAMHHLGIPTTRSLAVVGTGLPVYREQINEGAVLTRVAASHIRVGTFEYIRQFGSPEVLPVFLDYVIDRHYPDLKGAENPALALLQRVMERQIELVAHWTRVGFIHGVMNTDNMSIAGETIDYGPCAFMNVYHSGTVFSSIDRQGRYAFGNQPRIAHWNLGVFAGTLLPLIAEEEEAAIELAKEVLNEFPAAFSRRWYGTMAAKLGLAKPNKNSHGLVDRLLELMQEHKADYTNTFIALMTDQALDTALFQSDGFATWRKDWQHSLSEQNDPEQAARLMEAHNPKVIPRNHLIESVLSQAVEGDMQPFEELLERLKQPYRALEEAPVLQTVPDGFDQRYQTFCGT